MSSAGRPWFKFYAADWLADPEVMAMTCIQRGVFIQLLAAQWQTSDCTLPEDMAFLRCIGGASERDWNKCCPFVERLFPVCSGGVRVCSDGVQSKRANLRLRVEFEKATMTSGCRSEAGKASGRKRLEKSNKTRTKREQKGNESEAETELKKQYRSGTAKKARPSAGGGDGGLWNEIIEQWNKYAGLHGWVPVTSISRSGRRGDAFGARLKEPFFVEHWREALEKMAESPFFSGASKSGYRARFEFLVRPDAVDKVINDNYTPPQDKNEGDPSLPF